LHINSNKTIFTHRLSYLLSNIASIMQQLGQRIKELRKEKGMSQTELANLIGISYAQIGRYETKGVQPPAEVLKNIADVLGVSPDYLIYGSTDEKARASIQDKELIQQFKEIEAMDKNDQHIIKELIDAFITKKKLQQLVK